MSKRKLRHPDIWIKPMLHQAKADFEVARHLTKSGVGGKDGIYRGGAAPDASIDKFQQALEKLLKTLILRFTPNYSQLMFTHKILRDDRLWPSDKGVSKGLRTVGVELQKFYNAAGLGKDIKAEFLWIERQVPDMNNPGVKPDHGSITELPANCQYPFSGKKKLPTAPCDHFKNTQKLLTAEKAIGALLQKVLEDPTLDQNGRAAE